MTIKSRLKKLEALPVKRRVFMGSMEGITPEEAESAYNKMMIGPHPPLFAITVKGRVPLEDLSEQELSRIYKEYADGNFEIITEREI